MSTSLAAPRSPCALDIELEDDDTSDPACGNTEELSFEPWNCVRNRGDDDGERGWDDVETLLVVAARAEAFAATSRSVDPARRIRWLFVNRMRFFLGSPDGDLQCDDLVISI